MKDSFGKRVHVKVEIEKTERTQEASLDLTLSCHRIVRDRELRAGAELT